jgi:hypothetical protein
MILPAWCFRHWQANGGQTITLHFNALPLPSAAPGAGSMVKSYGLTSLMINDLMIDYPGDEGEQ